VKVCIRLKSGHSVFGRLTTANVHLGPITEIDHLIVEQFANNETERVLVQYTPWNGTAVLIFDALAKSPIFERIWPVCVLL
jgi:hypothetical protein